MLSLSALRLLRKSHSSYLITGVTWSSTFLRMASYYNTGDMRVAYKTGSEAFTEDQLVSATDPYAQFHDWFQQAKSTPEIIEPNAMCLATADKEGTPSARFVLLKGYGPEIGGFTFFTHYSSHKGKQLEENPKAALTFYWDKLNRQIRIEGVTEKVPQSESEAYFRRRPFASQIGAAASAQSTVIESRDVLIQNAESLLAKHSDGVVPKPETWGGYLVRPSKFEFWQGQSDRLHDRICFSKSESGWSLFRLAP